MICLSKLEHLHDRRLNFAAMSVRSKLCANFLRVKTILIAGTTGFLGLALVVKILQDAPCGKLFLLVRGGEK